MIAEPQMAATSPPSPFAHARIDDWDEALPWLLEKLRGARPLLTRRARRCLAIDP